MSLADISHKLSLFRHNETIVTNFSKAMGEENFKGSMKIPKDKNVIFILSGAVMGEIDFVLTSVPSLSAQDVNLMKNTQNSLNKIFRVGSNDYRIGIGVKEGTLGTIGAMIENANRDNSLVLYYPFLTDDLRRDPRLSINTTDTTTLIEISKFQNLATPKGKAMILVFPKNTDSKELTVRITRPSYMSQTCIPCVAHETESETHCDTKGKIDQRIFWGVTAGLLVLLLIVISACCSYTYNIKKSSQSPSRI